MHSIHTEEENARFRSAHNSAQGSLVYIFHNYGKCNYTHTLKMETADSSYKSEIVEQAIRCHHPEDSNLLTNRSFYLQLVAVAWDCAVSLNKIIKGKFKVVPLDAMKVNMCGGYRKIPTHFNPSAAWKTVVSFMPRQHYPGQKSLYPLSKSLSGIFGPDNNFPPPARNRIPDCTAHSLFN